MMFLALETYVVMPIIAAVLVQYAIATFCLVKLAFLDISKKEYVLWNVFILLVFFIGDIAFLIYWSKVKDKKKIPPITEVVTDANKPETEKTETDKPDETPSDEAPEKSETPSDDDKANGSDDKAQDPAEVKDGE